MAFKGQFSENKNPNWKGGPIELNCKVCGNPFLNQRWESKIYCSKECYDKFRTVTHTKICIFCGAQFKNRDASKYCSLDCVYAHRRELKRIKESNPPKNKYYNHKIPMEIREEIKKRDNYTCRICGNGISNIKHLVVHHIIPWRYNKSDEIDGLITLCPSCHTHLEYFTRVLLKKNSNLSDLKRFINGFK